MVAKEPREALEFRGSKPPFDHVKVLADKRPYLPTAELPVGKE